MTEHDLQSQIIAFVRAFGLHKGEETPCGASISVAQAYVLMELDRQTFIGQQILIDRLNLAKSTVSRLVKQMQNSGWIERERDPEDGRAWQWRLTVEGDRLAQKIAQARQEKFSQILEQIPESERLQVLQSLGILVEAIRGD